MSETVPSGTPALENPYVGPRPFKTSESRRFFGRELEARELIALVSSERLVLFYAQSGAGKSSLINARVLPAMAERGFAILPVGRVSGQAAAKPAASAATTENILDRKSVV
jgi:predicted GTPase